MLFNRDYKSPKQIEHQKYLRTEEWREVCEKVNQRCDYRCTFCGIAIRDMPRYVWPEHHHMSYARWKKGVDGGEHYDVTLACSVCHAKEHAKPPRQIKMAKIDEDLEKFFYEFEPPKK